MSEAKIKPEMLHVARAINTGIELFNKCLQRGLFRDMTENIEHLEAMSILETYVKDTIMESEPATLEPVAGRPDDCELDPCPHEDGAEDES